MIHFPFSDSSRYRFIASLTIEPKESLFFADARSILSTISGERWRTIFLYCVLSFIKVLEAGFEPACTPTVSTLYKSEPILQPSLI